MYIKCPYEFIATSGTEDLSGYNIIKCPSSSFMANLISASSVAEDGVYPRAFLTSSNVSTLRIVSLDLSSVLVNPICSFVTSCGFSLFGKRTAYYHDGSDALMMEWKRENE